MRVLILPGTYDLANLGDFAMLQVAVDRLGRLLPRARLRILAYGIESMRAAFPLAEIVPLRGRDLWLQAQLLPRGLPQGPARALQRRCPRTYRWLWTLKARALRGKYRDSSAFLEALETSDLFVMSGSGQIADPFRVDAGRALRTLALALDRGIPAVLLSQGIGPLEDPELRQRAAEVLPRADLIAVREDRFSLPALRELGVARDRILLTGDDGLAVGAPGSPPESRRCLGVNLRVAPYSGLGPATVASVRQVLGSAARRLQTRLLGIPITVGDYDSDVMVLRQLLDPEPAAMENEPACDTPAHCATRVARCRVVLAGSYHAGVFALAQGVPVIGLAATGYYRQKFAGLAGLFGDGCCVLDPQVADFPEHLATSLDQLWRRSDELSGSLRARATALVSQAELAYARIPELLRRRQGLSRRP